MSQILAMNFCSLTTRGHSPITWTLTPHSQLQITQGLHFPSSTAPTQLFALITHTPENNLTSPSPNHTHYINSGLSLALCRVLLAQLLYKAFPVFRVRFPVCWFLPVLLVYSLCLALWILFADRRPTLALGLFSALSLSYLFATVRPCLYWPCPIIKACRWIRMSHVSSAP